MRCEFFEFIEFIEFIELIEFIEFIELPGTPHKHNYDQGGSPQAELLPSTSSLCSLTSLRLLSYSLPEFFPADWYCILAGSSSLGNPLLPSQHAIKDGSSANQLLG